ncbi:MAG: hypothetical protein A2010_17760 [Nitrospirae bacterium GWD2_57_9]|nr:MAG: hypothetical protein A2010_17760 [Nitrospirae bacterium GWD2_57_9]
MSLLLTFFQQWRQTNEAMPQIDKTRMNQKQSGLAQSRQVAKKDTDKILILLSFASLRLCAKTALALFWIESFCSACPG